MSDILDVIVTRKSTQRQVNVRHADVLRFCDMAGMERPTKDSPLRLGSPAKGERPYLILSCLDSKDEAFEWVMGDTHAIWDTPKHQGEGPGAEKLTALIDRMAKGQKARIRVTGVRVVRPAEAAEEGDEDALEV